MAQCVPPDICFLCLSRDRKIFCLTENIKVLFGFLTDWYPQTDARVCWECRAMLEKLRRFKEQAKQAVCALERARIGLQPMSFECLSKVYDTQMLVIDLLVSDDANIIATNDCSVDISKSEICKAYKVEVEFEDENPKIEGEITEEVDLGVDVIDENIPDQIAEDDNDVESKCLTIDLTEADTENAIQHDTEQIILPQTILKINAPSSSAEEDVTSKNAENSSPIKKARGLAKTKVKCKQPMVVKIKKDLTTAEELLKRERRAEEQKYRLFQKGKDLECDNCGKRSLQKYGNRHKIHQHMKTHYKNIICEQCGFKCNAKYLLKKHMLAHLDPSYRPEECELCHKRFIDKYKLLVHTRSHTGERPFKCDNCERAFVCKEAMTAHIKEKHSDSGTLVKKTKQPRTQSSYWAYHYNHRTHNHKYKVIKNSENITYECNFCKEIFAQLNLFNEHYYSTHKNRIPCAECSRTFKSPYLWKHHFNIVHNKDNKLVSLKEDIDYKVIRHPELTYECNVCNEKFDHLDAFCKHYEYAHKKIPCTECKRTFKYPSLLKEHVKTVHRQERPHLCNICGVSYATIHRLRHHMSSHSNERNFKCNECLATFKYQSGLWSHKFIHKGVKPHQCDICNARFTLKGTLLGHMKVHTKDKPFECDICSKKFPWKRNLKNHLKTHLKE